MYTPKHLKLWTMPESYAGQVHPNTYVSFGQTRDSDCLDRSNFRVAWEKISRVCLSAQVIREKHWACGWVEWIAIEADDFDALKVADELAERYAAYPVLDENDLGELEQEEADKAWLNCYRPKERIQYIREHRNQFEFHDLRDMLNCVRGNYFGGYASELLG